MAEGSVPRHKLVEPRKHIRADIPVDVFVDDDSGCCVRDVNMADAGADTGGAKSVAYLLGYLDQLVSVSGTDANAFDQGGTSERVL